MTTLVLSFSNGSFFLQATRSIIKAWKGLNFGKIPSLTSKLAALEHLQNPHRLIMGEMVLPL